MIIKLQDVGFQLAIFRYTYIVVHCRQYDDVLQARCLLVDIRHEFSRPSTVLNSFGIPLRLCFIVPSMVNLWYVAHRAIVNGSKISVNGNVTSLSVIDLCKLLHKILGVTVGITCVILFGFVVDIVGFSSVWQGDVRVWNHGITQTPAE